LKKPPDRKLLLAVAVLVVAVSTMLARSADQARAAEPQTMTSIVLGGR
jgi:hypothetical protein